MIGYSLKIFINPKLTNASIKVKPNITPNIRGIVFLIPWLNPECEATILFGPGEQLVTNINKDKDIISGCIFMIWEDRCQLFVKDGLK